ncbi:MAG TPA: EAL domain-containing protein [Isosphaeraceae bacterium]|jgi:diguanylate cyclase (GGDEF)-like protein/PAS domain S-box-containing protein|nr:EAL domain-containing protein [Isosphaeraceae bacterium]
MKLVEAPVVSSTPEDRPVEAEPATDGSAEVARRGAALFRRHRDDLDRATDRLFAGLLAFQWLAGIAVALLVSPRAWAGSVSAIHPHVWSAVLLAGAIVGLPIALAMRRPGAASTRHAVAMAQMLMGALLIHLTGGRIETHFHVFGSLAFLAFYRDWRVLVTASAVVAADHILRGFFWPLSVYGVPTVEPWRWAEHSGWVVYEVVVLTWSCRRGIVEMRAIAERRAELEVVHGQIERRVETRTAELRTSEAQKAAIIATAPDAIVTMDHHGRIVEFNPAAEAIFGYRAAGAIGRPMDELIIPPSRGPAHREGLARYLATGRSGVLGRRIEAAARRADGSEFPAELTINAIARDAAPPLFLGFVRDITERRRAQERLEYQASHDPLTGLPNRTHFQAALRGALAEGPGGRGLLALLLVDLDRFKEVNDTLGHHFGDLLLEQLGPRLREVVAGPGVVARLGGDEFGVLLPGADAAAAGRAAAALLAAIRRPVVAAGKIIEVGASVGVALCPDHGDDPIALLRCADVAMYAAKRAGADFLVYGADQARYDPRRFEMIGELRRGIDDGQLVLHYQPKVDLRSRLVEGVEALVRWQHPREGLLAPGRFIALAEETGLIRPLTFWALREALRQSRTWHQEGINLRVAVNLSTDLLAISDFEATLVELLEGADALPGWLTLEITESAMMTDPARAHAIFTRLRDLGVKVSIDDFGTGYSSLAYLRDFPVDELKIDRSFVKALTARGSDACIVRTIIDLGHNLGLRVVAEGVEDAATADVLESLGCDSAQGYHFARPLAAADLAAWLEPARRYVAANGAPREPGPTAEPEAFLDRRGP